MNGTLAGTIVMLSALILNWTSLYISFPDRRKLSFYVAFTIVLSPITFAASFLVTGATSPIGLNGLVMLPFCIWLLKGRFFQTTFAVILQMLLTISEHALCGVIVRMLVPWRSSEYYLYWLIGSLILYAVHALVLLKWGHEFYKKLYTFGRDAEWAAYSFGAAFSFVIMIVMYNVLEEDWQIILMFLFIFWEFSVLCFAIINTHEKTRQRLDAEFARSIASSGRDHYQKMDALYEKLRIMRHDYKYHLSATLKMLRSGDAQSANEYLAGLETQLEGWEVKKYCQNSVINALVAGYAERCGKLEVNFNVCIDIPEAMSIPNYDLCIVIGNLLENAVEACGQSAKDCFINIETRNTSTHLLLMVQNSFNGTVAIGAYTSESYPISTKANGGIGIKSVREVASRNDGTLTFEWDEAVFTAFASVRR